MLPFRSPSKHVDRADYEDSTSNLKCHIKLCEPEKSSEADAITAFTSGATYSPTRLCFLLMMWCVSRHWPFAIVDNPEFQSILHMLYGKVKIPSCVTILHDIQNIINKSMAWLINRFEVRDPGSDSKYAPQANCCAEPFIQGPPLRGWLEHTKRHVFPWCHCALAREQGHSPHHS